MNRLSPIILLIVATIVAASVTTWVSHALIERRIDWDEVRKKPHCVFLVYLNEMVGRPNCSSPSFSPAEYPGPAAHAYFQTILQEAQPYYAPPARPIDIWTQGIYQGSYRRGWPFTTYQRVSIVDITVATPADDQVVHTFYVDTDGRKPHTNYTAMAGNFGVHFAGWLLVFSLLPHVIRFVCRRLYSQRRGFPVIMREHEA